MSALQFILALAVAVLSFFSWSKDEIGSSSSSHDCDIIHVHMGHIPIYSCSGTHSHKYSSSSSTGGGFKWVPICLSIIVLITMVAGILYQEEEAGDNLYFIASIFALCFLGYAIYYYFSYDGLNYMFWIVGCAPIVGIIDAISRSEEPQ